MRPDDGTRTLACALSVAIAVMLGGAPARAQAPAPRDSITLATVPDADDDPIPAPRFDGGMRLASRYLFLGRDVSDGLPVVQPWLEVDHDRYGAVLWVSEPNQGGTPREMRGTLQATADAGIVRATGGYTYRRFPHRRGWLPTQEVFVSLTGQPARFTPSLTVRHDFDAGRGFYSDLGIDRPIAPRIVLGGHFYAQRGYFGESGIPAVELHVGSALPFSAFTLWPTVAHTVTWPNGDFHGSRAVPATWLFSLDLSR